MNEEIIIAGSAVNDKLLSDFAMENGVAGFEPVLYPRCWWRN